MQILGINHIGLAPSDPQKARWFLSEILGLGFHGDELVESQATNTAIFASSQTTPQGESLLEILENQADKDGPIKRYLEKRGGGVHHLALTVDSIDRTITYLKSHNIQLISDTWQEGVCGTRVVFAHPKATGGLLIEFVENSKA